MRWIHHAPPLYLPQLIVRTNVVIEDLGSSLSYGDPLYGPKG